MTPSTNGRARPPAQRTVNPWEAVRRRPLLSVGAPLAIVALTVAFVLLVKPVYEATTSLRIDDQRSGAAVLQMLSSLSSGSEVFTEMAVLESRSVAEDVVRELDLQLVLEGPASSPRSTLFSDMRVDTAAPGAAYVLERSGEGAFVLTAEVELPTERHRPFLGPETETRELGEVRPGVPASIVGGTITLSPRALEHDQIAFVVLPFHEAVDELRSEVSVTRPQREADVVEVRYRGTDPRLVQAVPDAVAAAFLQRRRSAQSAEARGTVAFLDEQIGYLDTQLVEAEEALRQFREDNDIVSLDAEADAQIERLAGMQARRDILETEREALTQLLTEIEAGEVAVEGDQSPYRKLVAFPTLLGQTATAELLSQLAELENRRSELMSGRTAEDRDVRLITQRIDELESQLRTISETYLRGLSNQVASINATLGRFQDELSAIPAQEMTFLRLGRQAEILSELYTLLQTKQKEAEIAAAVEDQSVRVVDPAVFPAEPIRPKPWLSLALAIVLGGVVGVGGSILAEHADRSVRDRRSLQAATGAAVLGLIPTIPQRTGSEPAVPWLAANGADKRGVKPRLVGRIAAGSPAAEAYRSLRTNINFSRPETPPRLLVFTSPMPGDGKSTTAANLALVLAQQGGRVLLVDADMRRGVLNEVLKQKREPGLANVLFGSDTLEGATRTIDLEHGHVLHFLPCGTRPPNPAELVSTERMSDLLASMREAYDTVIFDAPPLNLVTDAALLGTRADGVVLVARAGVTEEGPLEYAVEQLESVRAPLLGTVLNGMDERRRDYYGSRAGKAYAYFDKE